jgi:hypothetical protein
MSFFTSYPAFRESLSNRLAARYDSLILPHLGVITGRTVLDLGSHDGRWAFAAAQARCAKVVGVDPRANLFEQAKLNFAGYGVPAERYELVAADALDYLVTRQPRFDTVFLFGVLYHLHYHVELVRQLRVTGASTIIIDTDVSGAPEVEGFYGNTMSFMREPVENNYNGALEAYPGCGYALVGHPSRNAVRFLFESFGYDLRELPWQGLLGRYGTEGLEDYAAGSRRTYLATLRA